MLPYKMPMRATLDKREARPSTFGAFRSHFVRIVERAGGALTRRRTIASLSDRSGAGFWALALCAYIHYIKPACERVVLARSAAG
jgi:hypothetical protein